MLITKDASQVLFFNINAQITVYSLQKIFHGTENFPRTASAVRFFVQENRTAHAVRGKFSEVLMHQLLYIHFTVKFQNIVKEKIQKFLTFLLSLKQYNS